MSDYSLIQRTREILLYQGDDLDKLDALAEEIERLQAASDDSEAPRLLSDADPLADAIAEHNALVEGARKRAVVVRLKPLGRRKFRDLVRQHPPREGNKVDEMRGFNGDDFPEALVPLSIDAPDLTQDQIAAFLDSLTDRQFEDIYDMAFYLNRSPIADPKAVPTSEPSPSDDETSN